MRPTTSTLAALAVFLLAPVAAADIPVTYDVDQKALKKDLAFGDPLTFDLYTAPGSGEPSREIVPAGRNRAKTLAPPARLERATPGLGNRCSIHLSYGGASRKSST